MSRFIDGSKHAAGTAMVEAHFGTVPVPPQHDAATNSLPPAGINPSLGHPGDRGINAMPKADAGDGKSWVSEYRR